MSMVKLNETALLAMGFDRAFISALRHLLVKVGSGVNDPTLADAYGLAAFGANTSADSQVAELSARMASLEESLAALMAPVSVEQYVPPSASDYGDRGLFPMQWPTGNPRGDGSWADLWVPQQNTFADNVISLRNQSRNAAGTLYGMAAICMLDAAGNERGAFGYSRNSAIQPAGYIPDIVYVEYGDPFACDGNPSSLKMICTMGATSPYFPGTSFVSFENDAKTGETSVRSRGGKPINLEGKTLVGNLFTPTANGKLQVREDSNEFVVAAKNTASKEWVWGVNSNTMYFRNATDAVSGIFLANGGRTMIGNATDDGATKLQVNGGGIKHGSSTLLSTSVALTNGAAAAAGTLSNAPVAGNPTKWIPINDNGTTRYIPAW